MRHSLLPALLLILAACEKLPSRRDADYSSANIEERIDALRNDLEAVLGSDLGPVDVRLSGHETIAEHIAAQLKQTYASLRGGLRDKALDRFAEAQAEQLAYGVFALVEPKTGVLHVNKYTFQFLARLAPSWRGIGSPDFLDVILAHELVHVWQVRHRGLGDFMGQPETTGELIARAAVIEGHAHFVAKEVAGRRGIEWAFHLLLHVQTRLPPGMKNTFFAKLLEVIQQSSAFPYAGGLKMWEAVVARMGESEANKALYGTPPTTVDGVDKPHESWDGWR